MVWPHPLPQAPLEPASEGGASAHSFAPWSCCVCSPAPGSGVHTGRSPDPSCPSGPSWSLSGRRSPASCCQTACGFVVSAGRGAPPAQAEGADTRLRYSVYQLKLGLAALPPELTPSAHLGRFTGPRPLVGPQSPPGCLTGVMAMGIAGGGLGNLSGLRKSSASVLRCPCGRPGEAAGTH